MMSKPRKMVSSSPEKPASVVRQPEADVTTSNSPVLAYHLKRHVALTQTLIEVSHRVLSGLIMAAGLGLGTLYGSITYREGRPSISLALGGFSKREDLKIFHFFRSGGAHPDRNFESTSTWCVTGPKLHN